MSAFWHCCYGKPQGGPPQKNATLSLITRIICNGDCKENPPLNIVNFDDVDIPVSRKVYGTCCKSKNGEVRPTRCDDLMALLPKAHADNYEPPKAGGWLKKRLM